MTFPSRSSVDGMQRNAGFTLLEMLVVLTIVVVCLGMMPATLRVAQKAQGVAARSAQQTSERLALKAIEERVASARAVFQSTSSGLARLLFEGEPDRLRFVTSMDDGPDGGGLYVVDLLLSGVAEAPTETPADERWLTMTVRPYAAANGENAAVWPVSLLPTERLSFRYFGHDPGRQDMVWQDRWRLSNRLPDLIEVSIVPRNAESQPPRTVVVALPLRKNS